MFTFRDSNTNSARSVVLRDCGTAGLRLQYTLQLMTSGPCDQLQAKTSSSNEYDF